MTGPASSRLPGRLALEAALAAAQRQVLAEWRGSPLHRSVLSQPKPEGLAVQPRDLRPRSEESGARLLAGSFVFAGSALHAGVGGDPWNRPSPSRRFAVALHRMGWIGDLLTQGEPGAEEALRLVLNWSRLFSSWNGFAWGVEVLERRVFNLACAARTICAGASDAEISVFTLDLARQARHLLTASEGPFRASERAAVAAVAGAALAGQAGERLLTQALARLEKALPETVAADGGHASRSPQAALELLLDLRTLDEALHARGLAAPDEMQRAMDRLSGAVRFLTLADGGLPAFQGGEEARADYVAAAHAEDEAGDRPIPIARNGYQRIEAANLQVVVDAAPPAAGAWSVAACAQPLAVEVLAGGRRMIVNSGWTPDAVAPAALRVADAASTATLGDLPCGAPMRGFMAEVLGPRLADVYDGVEARRQEAEQGRWLELSHDGWVRRFGLRHERRIYVDAEAGELRGEDRFVPVTPDRPDGRRFVPFMVRFHIHPDVQVSRAQDRRSVLLRPHPADGGWWLRNDAIEVEIEPSVHFQQGQPRRTNQIVLRGQVRLETGARVRWKLAAAEAWPPPR
jgi:uncharacterized heparinase superfamily protein